MQVAIEIARKVKVSQLPLVLLSKATWDDFVAFEDSLVAYGEGLVFGLDYDNQSKKVAIVEWPTFIHSSSVQFINDALKADAAISAHCDFCLDNDMSFYGRPDLAISAWNSPNPPAQSIGIPLPQATVICEIAVYERLQHVRDKVCNALRNVAQFPNLCVVQSRIC